MNRTATIAEVAAEAYRERARLMEREAFLLQLKDKPLSARICKQYAFIARNAARAEEWSDAEARQ